MQDGVRSSFAHVPLNILILKPELLPEGHSHFSIREDCLVTGSHWNEFTKAGTAKKPKKQKQKKTEEGEIKYCSKYKKLSIHKFCV